MKVETMDWLQRVRLTAAEPTSWLQTARMLRQAAEDLWIAGNAHDSAPGTELNTTVLASWVADGSSRPEMGGSTRNVCFMLFGYSLENLAKGIIYCKKPDLVGANRLTRIGNHGHNLSDLFARACISVSDQELAVLERTTRLTVWKGKYPVDLSFQKVGAADPVLGYIALGDSWPPDEYEALSKLYDKAKDALSAVMQATPPLPEDHPFDGTT